MRDNGAFDNRNRMAALEAFWGEARARFAGGSEMRPAEAEAARRIGRLFRQLRKSRGVTIAAVAELAGLDETKLALLEHGLLHPNELDPAFLSGIGSALDPGHDSPAGAGGVFDAVANAILKSSAWANTDAAATTIDRLTAAVEAEKANDDAREEAVWELGEHVYAERVRSTLANVLATDPAPRVRIAAMESLSATAHVDTVRRALVSRFADAHPRVRACAAEAIARTLSDGQAACARVLSRLGSTRHVVSPLLMRRLHEVLDLKSEASFGLRLQVETGDPPTKELVSVDSASTVCRAALTVNGGCSSVRLALGMSFYEPWEWMGHRLRIEMVPHVDRELARAGWRVNWESFGPELVDSTAPVSVFGHVDVRLGNAASPEHRAQSQGRHESMRDLAAIVGEALTHDRAVSRLAPTQ